MSRGAKVQPEARRFALTSDPHNAADCRTASVQSFLGRLRGREICFSPAICKAQVEFWGLVGGAMQGGQGVYLVRMGTAEPSHPGIPSNHRWRC